MRVFVPVVFLVLASIVATGTQAAVSPCDSVWGNLYPCDLYMPQEGTILENYCQGLRALSEEGITRADAQSICYCVKSYLALVPSTNLQIYAALPGVCNVTLAYKLNLSPDCNNSYRAPASMRERRS